MNRRLESTPWRDLLPDTRRWLDSIVVRSVDRPATDDLVVVPVREDTAGSGFRLCR